MRVYGDAPLTLGKGAGGGGRLALYGPDAAADSNAPADTAARCVHTLNFSYLFLLLFHLS